MPLIPAIVIFVIVGAVALMGLRKSAATNALSEECRTIQKRIAALKFDTNPAERSELEAQLRNCAADLAASGVAVDMSAIALGNARNTAQAIDNKWADYKGTSYDDLIKRDNTRRDMQRLQGQLATNLVEAARNAATPTARDAVRRETLTQITKSLDRVSCLLTGGAGCGRYGVNEPDWDERARDELAHGALALGLRSAIETGYRTPQDRGIDINAPGDVWSRYRRSLASGNFATVGLFRIGELTRLLEPSWDDFGGGPHYAGQTEAIRRMWDTVGISGSPYSIVAPIAPGSMRTATQNALSKNLTSTLLMDLSRIGNP